MYLVFIIYYIRHLMNEPKNQTFVYISDRRLYLVNISTTDANYRTRIKKDITYKCDQMDYIRRAIKQ
jgi:hypothetical protein